MVQSQLNHHLLSPLESLVECPLASSGGGWSLRRCAGLLVVRVQMPVCRFWADKIEALAEAMFATAGLHERSDLPRLLRTQIEVISPGAMVVTEKFSDWNDSNRRIDLLRFDKEVSLVAIELKRTEDGGHMELQAIRYAAMVSAITFAQVVQTHQKFRDKLGVKGCATHDQQHRRRQSIVLALQDGHPACVTFILRDRDALGGYAGGEAVGVTCFTAPKLRRVEIAGGAAIIATMLHTALGFAFVVQPIVWRINLSQESAGWSQAATSALSRPEPLSHMSAKSYPPQLDPPFRHRQCRRCPGKLQPRYLILGPSGCGYSS